MNINKKVFFFYKFTLCNVKFKFNLDYRTLKIKN